MKSNSEFQLMRSKGRKYRNVHADAEYIAEKIDKKAIKPITIIKTFQDENSKAAQTAATTRKPFDELFKEGRPGDSSGTYSE